MHISVTAIATDSVATALSVSTTFTVMCTSLSVDTAVTLVCTVILQCCRYHRCFTVVSLHRCHRCHSTVKYTAVTILSLPPILH